MVDLAKISALARDNDGIWVSSRASKGQSFPELGNLRRREFEDTSFWYQHRSEALRLLLNRFPPAGVLLDVGGGNGAVSLTLERAGWEVVLLEPDRNGALFARRRGLSNVICASLETAELDEGSFAAVGLFDVLEHIEEEAAFLERLAGVLRPAGRLYLTVPAYGGLWSAADLRAGHFRRYRLSRLGEVLVSAGLRPVFSTYLFAPLVVPVWLLRHLPYRLGRGGRPDEPDGRRHHSARNRLSGGLLRGLLGLERTLLRREKSLPFGTSCLMIAAKPADC